MDDPDHPARSLGAARLVDLRVPADPFWMSPLRALVTDIAMRAEFDLDRTADVTLVVDEVCGLFVRLLDPGDTMRCRVVVTPDAIELVVAAADARRPSPEELESTFAWQVVLSLADRAEPIEREGTSFAVGVVLCRLSTHDHGTAGVAAQAWDAAPWRVDPW